MIDGGARRHGPERAWWARPGVSLALVVGVCAAVYLPWLGTHGLTSSEGHRVIPALAMLESGDPLRLEMFEQTYLRKPPGMPCAIALSTLLFGENEWAWRAPSALSATLLAVLAWGFAWRWFGRPWALAAGLAQALLPVAWNSARSAEIESLNNLATGAAALIAVELLVGRPAGMPSRSRGATAALGVGLAAALVLMGLAKGPAGLPVMGGVLIGVAFIARSLRPLMNPGFWGAVAGAGAALGALAVMMVNANPPSAAVTQDVREFLWSRETALGVLTLPAVAFAAAMPAALAVLLPWGREARLEADIASAGETREHAGASRSYTVALTLAAAWIASVLIFTAAGVSNPRYVMPAAALLPPLAAYAYRSLGALRRVRADTGMAGAEPWLPLPKRRPFFRAFALGHPLAWLVVFTVAAPIYQWTSERSRGRVSSLPAAGVLAAALPEGAEVWAHDVIETRPDVLMYATELARADGRRVRVRWMPVEIIATQEPPAGVYLVLLGSQFEGGEDRRYAAAVEAGRLELVAETTLRRYRLQVLRAIE